MLKGMRHLQHLHMAQNEVRGDLTCCPSDEPNCLDHVKTLDLKDNHLTGQLPECLLNLPEIGILDFRRNSLSGDFPSKIPHNPYMMVLDVRQQSGSGMVGKLPDFTPLENLALIGLSENNFFGDFPALPCKLEAIHLSDNQLEGSIHSSVDCLRKVWIFDAGGNQLTGPLPDSLTSQPYLQLLNVSFNRLNGVIPDTWKASNIKMLSLNSNEFTGSIPTAIGKLNRLSMFNVSSNHLSGTLDNFVQEMTFNNFVQFDFSHNLISGPIPENLSKLAALDFFVFPGPDRIMDGSYNMLDGDLPQSILDKAEKLSESSLEFSLNFQGNSINCPDAQTASQLRAKIPQLTSWTCKDSETLRTIGGSPIPEEVSLQMEQVKEMQKSVQRAASQTDREQDSTIRGPTASSDIQAAHVLSVEAEQLTSPVQNNSSSNIGAILGGLFGGVAAMAIVAGVA
eukprot:scaffold228212_cov46-Prasinocladus_malaysianus.AAC.1